MQSKLKLTARVVLYMTLYAIGGVLVGQVTIQGNEAIRGILLNYDAEVFVVPEGLSPNEILIAIDHSTLTKVENPVSPGFTTDIFWVQTQIISDIEREVVLELSLSDIDTVKCFKITPNGPFQLMEAGDHMPFSSRPIEYRTFAFHIALQPGMNGFLWSIDKRQTSATFPLKMWDKTSFENHVSNEQIYYGIFFGLIAAIILFSLILFFLYKSSLFGYYAMYLILMSLYNFTTLGYSSQFLYPTSEVWINDYLRLSIAVINSAFAAAFFTTFLRIQRYFPKRVKVIKVAILILLSILPVAMLFPEWTRVNGVMIINVIYSMILITALTIVISAFSILRYEILNASVFLISSFFAICGVATSIFFNYGMVDPTLLSVDPIMLGLGLEILILSVAMTARVKTLIELKRFQERKTLEQKASAILNPEEVTYLQSDGHYLIIHRINSTEKELIRMTFDSLFESEYDSEFIKTHRSFAVNIAHVKMKYAEKLVLNDGTEIPVSRNFKSSLDETLLKL